MIKLMNCSMRLCGISQATPAVCTLMGTKPAIALAAWRNLLGWCPWNNFLSVWFCTSSSCSHRHPCCAQRWGLFLLLPRPGSRTLYLQLWWPVLTTTTSGVTKRGRTRTIPSPDASTEWFVSDLYHIILKKSCRDVLYNIDMQAAGTV